MERKLPTTEIQRYSNAIDQRRVREFFEQGRISAGVGQDASYSAVIERAGGTFVSSSPETLTGPNNRPDDSRGMGRSNPPASF